MCLGMGMCIWVQVGVFRGQRHQMALELGIRVLWASDMDTGDWTQAFCKSHLCSSPLTYLPSPNRGILNYITSLKCIFMADLENVVYSVEENLLYGITEPYHITQTRGKREVSRAASSKRGVTWGTHARLKFSGSFLNQDKKQEAWHFSVHTRPGVSTLSLIQ